MTYFTWWEWALLFGGIMVVSYLFIAFFFAGILCCCLTDVIAHEKGSSQ